MLVAEITDSARGGSGRAAYCRARPPRNGKRIDGEEAMSDYKIFEAGDVVLQSGLTYRGARLAYKTQAARPLDGEVQQLARGRVDPTRVLENRQHQLASCQAFEL